MNFRKSLAIMAVAATISLPAWASSGVYSFTGKIALQGAISAREISAADFAAIGQTTIETKVLTLGDQPHKVTGVLARDLLNYVGSIGNKISVVALDGYTMEIPMEDIQQYDVVIATEIDGKALTVRDKGPAWIIYPVSQHKELDDTVYEARSVWQAKSITIE